MIQVGLCASFWFRNSMYESALPMSSAIDVQV